MLESSRAQVRKNGFEERTTVGTTHLVLHVCDGAAPTHVVPEAAEVLVLVHNLRRSHSVHGIQELHAFTPAEDGTPDALLAATGYHCPDT